jgi:hypothetical protein
MSAKIKIFLFLTLTVIISFVAATFLAEFTLGLMAKERGTPTPDYGDTWRSGELGRGGFLKENLDIFVKGGTGKVRWHNNAAGFRRDQETGDYPPPGTLRILSLGDSFTAGCRVGQEETFSYLLEDWLNRKYVKTEVLISCIEEPATGLYYLERFGSQFHPQVVLLGITLGNDIAQAYLALDPRGGYTLSLKPGETLIKKNRTPPTIGFTSGLEKLFIPPAYLKERGTLAEAIHRTRWWFKRLRLVKMLWPDAVAITSWYGNNMGPDKIRLFDPVNGLGVYADPAPPEVQEAYRRLFRLLDGFKAFCEPRGIFLAVLLFPQRFQVNPADWERAVDKYGLKKSRFDLMGPNKKITAFCRERGICLIDPTAAMAQQFSKTGTNLYFPLGDMHWNREGHRAFFACARESFGILADRGFAALRARDSRRLSLGKPARQEGRTPGALRAGTESRN